MVGRARNGPRTFSGVARLGVGTRRHVLAASLSLSLNDRLNPNTEVGGTAFAAIIGSTSRWAILDSINWIQPLRSPTSCAAKHGTAYGPSNFGIRAKAFTPTGARIGSLFRAYLPAGLGLGRSCLGWPSRGMGASLASAGKSSGRSAVRAQAPVAAHSVPRCRVS
jgi:hypothetical protein